MYLQILNHTQHMVTVKWAFFFRMAESVLKDDKCIHRTEQSKATSNEACFLNPTQKQMNKPERDQAGVLPLDDLPPAV